MIYVILALAAIQMAWVAGTTDNTQLRILCYLLMVADIVIMVIKAINATK